MLSSTGFLTRWIKAPRRILFFSAAAITLIGVNTTSFAQGGACGDAPAIDDVRFKGELDAKAQFLSRFIGDAGLKGQVDFAREDVLKKYPNADKLRLNQYVLYILCVTIMADTKMSTSDKLNELRKTRSDIFAP